jgi:hypothetical protein
VKTFSKKVFKGFYLLSLSISMALNGHSTAHKPQPLQYDKSHSKYFLPLALVFSVWLIIPSGQIRWQMPQAVHASCKKFGRLVRQAPVLFINVVFGETEILFFTPLDSLIFFSYAP